MEVLVAGGGGGVMVVVVPWWWCVWLGASSKYHSNYLLREIIYRTSNRLSSQVLALGVAPPPGTQLGQAMSEDGGAARGHA